MNGLIAGYNLKLPTVESYSKIIFWVLHRELRRLILIWTSYVSTSFSARLQGIICVLYVSRQISMTI